MRDVLFLALGALLSGCTFAHPITLADGSHGERISCDGLAQSMADCYERAGQECPRGFDVVDENGEAHPFIYANNNFAMGGAIVKRSLMVKCH